MSTDLHQRDTATRTEHGLSGVTVWLTGLPSAGKSTIAHALAADLEAVFARYRTHPRPAAKVGDEPAHVSVYLHLLPFEELPL